MSERKPLWAGFALAFALALLSTPTVAWAAGAPAAPGTVYTTSSWALGVAVPEGARLQGGGDLVWDRVTNVTAVVVLPNVTARDGMTYAVMSLMTKDGAVLQAAAGSGPNFTGWLAYAWFIPDANAIPLTYVWLLNASAPAMDQGARLSISLFWAAQTWNLEVKDEDTGLLVAKQFPGGVPGTIKSGDQEVFALESYSRSQAAFQDMGNLTLSGLLVDGQRVVSGFYSYGYWSTIRNPLFAVGASGVAPPPFISLQVEGNGSMTWAFDTVWQGSGGEGFASLFIITMLLAVLAVVVSLVLLTRRLGGPPVEKGASRGGAAPPRMARLPERGERRTDG